MSKSLFKNYNRRNLIKTLGVASAAPFIPVLQAEAATSTPKRVCFMTTPNCISQEVVPDGNGANMQFREVLQPVQAWKNQITYLHGIDMKTYYAKAIENGHPSTIAMLLTGALTTDPGTDAHSGGVWPAEGMSIDHFIGNRLAQSTQTQTKYKVINAGVKVGYFAAEQIYPTAGNSLRPESDVGNLHSRIFNGIQTGNTGGAVDPVAAQALASKKSVLDSVLNELNLVKNKVATEDRQKIEAHITGIREIETRIDYEQTGTGANCSVPDLPGNSNNSDTDYRLEGEGMIDILTHAFACDQSRVATLQWQNGASGQVFSSKGLTDSHHSYTHEDYANSGVERRLASEWYGERFAYFVEKLASIPEGDGTMLDNTLIVWTSEHSDYGQHGRRNIPFTLAGNLGGAINVGQKHDYSNNPLAHNDVYVSVAQAMGLTDVNSFGLESVCAGALPGLLK